MYNDDGVMPPPAEASDDAAEVARHEAMADALDRAVQELTRTVLLRADGPLWSDVDKASAAP
jgi:hypothetical protein